MRTPTLCIYHGNCADGFSAAWSVWKRFQDDVRFHAGTHGGGAPDVTGEDVLIIDFSYPLETLKTMASRASSITILDHHKTAEQAIAPLLADGTLLGEFDMERSGAVMAWNYCFPHVDVPKLLQHVQDRDLWRFAMPNTREIQATVFSFPYTFPTWQGLVDLCETPDGLATMIQDGKAIERKAHKDIAELLPQTARDMTIGGITVKVANLPYTMSSDAANILAQTMPFGACYFDREDGRVFSLRSRKGGIDVSAIARQYGGGGHYHAAGFHMPRGWEGDAD